MKMNRFRISKKDGSVIIGALLIIAIIIPFFIFAYEMATLIVLKEKAQNIADNISLSSVLEIDEFEIRERNLKIDETKAKETAKKVFNESYSYINKDSTYLKIPQLEVYILNEHKDSLTIEDYTVSFKKYPILVVYTELQLKNKMIFFKDTKIKNISKSQVYSVVDLKKMEKDEMENITLKQIYNDLLRFENR